MFMWRHTPVYVVCLLPYLIVVRVVNLFVWGWNQTVEQFRAVFCEITLKHPLTIRDRIMHSESVGKRKLEKENVDVLKFGKLGNDFIDWKRQASVVQWLNANCRSFTSFNEFNNKMTCLLRLVFFYCISFFKAIIISVRNAINELFPPFINLYINCFAVILSCCISALRC